MKTTRLTIMWAVLGAVTAAASVCVRAADDTPAEAGHVTLGPILKLGDRELSAARPRHYECRAEGSGSRLLR